MTAELLRSLQNSVEWKQKYHSREYLDYFLIKNLYHCTPTELDQQPTHIVDLYLRILSMEAEWEWKEQKRANQK